jgi:hypothetical protein
MKYQGNFLTNENHLDIFKIYFHNQILNTPNLNSSKLFLIIQSFLFFLHITWEKMEITSLGLITICNKVEIAMPLEF